MTPSRPGSRSALLVVSVLAATQVHCSGCGVPARQFDPPEPVEVAVDASPTPKLAVAVNQSGRAQVAAGWPWVIDASILHPAAFGGASTAPLELVGAQGTAESALSLELRDPQGNPVALAFERLGAPLGSPITLEPTTELDARWRVAAEQTAGLADGLYSLSLRLQTAAFTIISPPAQVLVSSAPDAGAFAGQFARADEAMARGAWAEAEAEVDGVLAAAPESIRALTRKGEVREGQGDLPGAFLAFDRALNEALEQEPGAPEGGPRHLRFNRERLRVATDGGAY